MVAVLVACTPDGGSSAPPATGALDGVWRTAGYGLLVSVHDGQAQTFETTAVGCLPAHTHSMRQLGAPGPGGAVEFGTSDGRPTETLQPTGEGRAELHVLGTAAPIDVSRLPAMPASCAQPPANDPVTNFDVFWSTFAENYNSFGRKNVDWAATRNAFRPRVTPTTTDDQLFDILTEMIRPLGDAHTTLDGPGHQSFVGKRPGTRDESDVSRHTATKAVDDYLRHTMQVSDIQTFANDRIAYADLPDGRGYLRVTSFEDYDSDHNHYPENSEALDAALAAIFTPERTASWRALIVDVRFNTGGDDALGLQLAGRLTNTPYLAYTKQARDDPNNPNHYGAAHKVTVTPAAGPRYSGPIQLLTSDLTVSAGETFAEALLARTPAPARIGTATQGVFSDDMHRQLPNGWSFTLGNEAYVAPDGHDYEGAGIPPTIPTPVFSPTDLSQDRDTALETALATP